ncbi:MAG: DsrE family protein [Magnetospirillum sp.]|nr:DsrE family protein [Magnetospirillum sp.]
MKLISAAWLAVALVSTAPALAEDLANPKPDWDHPRKLVLQLDSADPKKMNLILNNALNSQNFYGQDNVKIAIVAFGPGLHAVLKDSPVADRVSAAEYAHVEFLACGQTMKTMHKTVDDLLPGVTKTEAGVPTLIERQLKGWTYIAP